MKSPADYYRELAVGYGDRDYAGRNSNVERLEWVTRQALSRRECDPSLQSVYEVGCGDGRVLWAFQQAGFRVQGSDLLPEMIQEAVKRLSASDPHFRADTLAAGVDLRDPEHLYSEIRRGPFDIVCCLGAFSNLPDDGILPWLRRLTRGGGLLYLEARNDLFNFFALNDRTVDLLADLCETTREALAPYLKEFTMRPVIEPTLRRWHNPITIRSLLAEAGFRQEQLFFYHDHTRPPWMPECRHDAHTRRQDWRALFRCSAFVVEAVAT